RVVECPALERGGKGERLPAEGASAEDAPDGRGAKSRVPIGAASERSRRPDEQRRVEGAARTTRAPQETFERRGGAPEPRHGVEARGVAEQRVECESHSDRPG